MEIGKGTHERMVVDLRRLTKRLDGLDFGAAKNCDSRSTAKESRRQIFLDDDVGRFRRQIAADKVQTCCGIE